MDERIKNINAKIAEIRHAEHKGSKNRKAALKELKRLCSLRDALMKEQAKADAQSGKDKSHIEVVETEAGGIPEAPLLIPLMLTNPERFIELTFEVAKEMAEKHIDIPSMIDEVIYSKPATIVKWADGTKTVVVCQKNDRGYRESYDPEKGLALAIIKKLCGNNGNYYELFKTFTPEK